MWPYDTAFVCIRHDQATSHDAEKVRPLLAFSSSSDYVIRQHLSLLLPPHSGPLVYTRVMLRDSDAHVGRDQLDAALTSGKLAGVDEVKQYALHRRALLLEVKRLTREVQTAEGQLGMARTDSWVKVTRTLIASLSILKAQLASAQERLVAFDKDLGND